MPHYGFWVVSTVVDDDDGDDDERRRIEEKLGTDYVVMDSAP